MVEWKSIEDLGEFFGGLTGKSKNDFIDGNAKFITYINVFENYALNTNSTGVVKINPGEKQNKIQQGDILFTGSSETPEEVGMSCVVTEPLTEDYYMNSFCFGLRLFNPSQYNIHYFKYIFRSLPIRKAISKSASGVTRFNISKARFGKILIPIPTITEQNKIVDILDSFTSSIENLNNQIKLRRKQFEFYCDHCFGGDYNGMVAMSNDSSVYVVPFSELGTITRGKRFVRDDIRESGQPCIHYGDMYTYYGTKAYQANTFLDRDFPKKMRYAHKGDVVIVGAGENDYDIGVGVVWLGDEPAAVHDACYILEHNLNPMYISYYLRSNIYHQQLKKYVSSGKISSFSAEGLGKVLIPIQPKEKQQEIVSALEIFEESIARLEKMVELRQKQYEYYREKLLTFK